MEPPVLPRDMNSERPLVPAADLADVLKQVQAGLDDFLRDRRPGTAQPTRMVLDVALALGEHAPNPTSTAPISVENLPSAAPTTPHRLTLEWQLAPAANPGGSLPSGQPPAPSLARPDSLATPGASAPSPTTATEEPTGGDVTTMRRRLQLILGGPPGFTTGAKAEVLADLLNEFGRPALLETLRREWIREFDTGPEASSSMSSS